MTQVTLHEIHYCYMNFVLKLLTCNYSYSLNGSVIKSFVIPGCGIALLITHDSLSLTLTIWRAHFRTDCFVMQASWRSYWRIPAGTNFGSNSKSVACEQALSLNSFYTRGLQRSLKGSVHSHNYNSLIKPREKRKHFYGFLWFQ